jgi:phosphate/sulfate permease
MAIRYTPLVNDMPIDKTPLYDYTDPRVRQAGYAAIIYGVISLASALLILLKARLDAIPASAVALIVAGVIAASISGGLAFGIFRRSKVAVILMIALVVIPQLYTWFVARSVAGTLVSIVVTAFLLRGAKAMFEPPDDDKPSESLDTKGSRIR